MPNTLQQNVRHRRLAPAWHTIMGLCLCLFLSHCTVFKPGSPTASDASWSVQGKISIRTKTDVETINFKWQQSGNDYLIDLWGPLGQGATQIEKQNDKVILQRGGEILQQADNAEQLLLHATGWQLPVSHLQYWARGQLAPGDGKRLVNPENSLQTIEQYGWIIDYRRMHENGKWPKLLIAKHGDNLAVKMVFREWQFFNNPAVP